MFRSLFNIAMLSRKLLLCSALLTSLTALPACAEDAPSITAVRKEVHTAISAACNNAPETKRYVTGFADAVLDDKLDALKENLYKMSCLVGRAQQTEPKNDDVIECATQGMSEMLKDVDKLRYTDGMDDATYEASQETLLDVVKSTATMTEAEICATAGL